MKKHIKELDNILRYLHENKASKQLHPELSFIQYDNIGEYLRLRNDNSVYYLL